MRPEEKKSYQTIKEKFLERYGTTATAVQSRFEVQSEIMALRQNPGESIASYVSVTGAFRPDGLVFTRPCKIFQAKVFKEKIHKDKRIHDNLILLRVTFSIIVLESLRRIARWVVFAVISFFCKLANTTPSHPLF